MENAQKKVLIVNAQPLFREFLKEKFSSESIVVETAEGENDAYMKLIRIIPDLIIIDVEHAFSELMDFLEEKIEDSNARRIPIIIAGPILERSQISSFVKYGVIKYFTKPIKFDVFFEAVGKNLRVNLSMDSTPCLLEIHHNEDIIFIEIARGLNREKIALLKYKLAEMIDSYKIREPKIVVMMSDLELSFVDGITLEYLIDTITFNERILKRNVKILSLDNFMHEFIEGHSEYSDIKVITDLTSALGTLVGSGNYGKNATEVIANSILTSEDKDNFEDREMQFDVRKDGLSEIDYDSEGSVLNMAVVDDDEVVRTILSETFSAIGATTDTFETGAAFMEAIKTKDYDFAVVDILMSGINGFDILNSIRARTKPIPTIIYSQAAQREYVVQALSLGAKSYLTKPQKPAAILKKVMEILHEQI